MPKKKNTSSIASRDKLGKTRISPIAEKVDNSITEPVFGTKNQSEVFKDISQPIIDSFSNRTPWTQKLDHFYRMRMRIRKDKSFPFAGCSNLRMPTAEKYIRKRKAALYNVIYGNKPHGLVTPGPRGNMEAAFKLEYYLDWLLETKIKMQRKLPIIIDKQEEKGFSFAEVIWRVSDEKRKVKIELSDLPAEILQRLFATDDDGKMAEDLAKLLDVDMSESVRSFNLKEISKAIQEIAAGKTSITLTIADETYNNPDVVIHDPQYVYVPIDSGVDVQECRMIAVEVYEPWNTVKEKARAGIYNQQVIDEMETFSKVPMDAPSEGKGALTADRTSQALEDMREGITRTQNPSQNVKLWRVYAWYDLDGDGIEERNVFILAPEWHKVLSAFPYTYAHKKWPIVRFDAELIDDRWFAARGVPEMLEDIIKEIDTQHNQKVDQQTIRNTPMFAYRSGLVNPRLVKFVPGQGIPINGLTPLNDALSVLRNESSVAEFSYRDEEMLLKSEIQEIYGQVDYSLQSQINRREPRTASEVNAQQQSSNTVFSLDSGIFSDSVSEVMTQIIQLLQQYLPDEVYFSVVGEAESIRLGREEIQGEYIVRVRGNDISTNPAVRLQMAQAKMNTLLQPYFIQSGVVTPVGAYLMAKEFLQSTGDFTWNQKIAVPQPPPPPAPPPAITQVKTSYTDLTPKEKAQVLASGGIQPDIEGNVLDKQLEVASEMSEMKERNGTGA